MRKNFISQKKYLQTDWVSSSWNVGNQSKFPQNSLCARERFWKLKIWNEKFLENFFTKNLNEKVIQEFHSKKVFQTLFIF